jgi:hypothetical protein
MTFLAAVWRELVGLFVDDGALALHLVVVVIAAGLWIAIMPAHPLVAGAVLLLGPLAALLVTVMRASRRP